MKIIFRGSCSFLLSCILLMWAAAALAQDAGFVDRISGLPTANSSMGEREVLIEAQVWGQVTRPGMYKVPVSTDVVALISYAGGPTDYAALSRVRLVRNGFPKGKTVKLNLERYAGNGDRSAIPMLEPGDVVVVPTTITHSISVFTGFLSQAAVLITAYLVIAGKR